MKRQHTILIGKTLKRLARLRGGGSALPGLVVEKLDPRLMAHALQQLPHGVILVSGTNGKTTTTKMVVELLRGSGLRVFTNRTGSNFTRGVVASLLEDLDNDGRLPFDVAVLELDEAHAVHFVKQHPPSYVLLLNVMRDQLDRFGEIDHTAQLLTKVAQSATKGVVLNADDPRIAGIAGSLNKNIAVSFFGADQSLHPLFVNDDDFHAAKSGAEPRKKQRHSQQPEVQLMRFDGNQATYQYDGALYSVNMQLDGVYNFLNAAGAACLALLVRNRTAKDVFANLNYVTPAFGRGENITMPGGTTLHLVLVKNPAGFRLALSSLPNNNNYAAMIAINDHYADGRDMSWLWDVDFASFRVSGIRMVGGIRAYDMALRLQYDEVKVDEVEPDIKKALSKFVSTTHAQEKYVYCTYTAMLEVRRHLKRYAEVNEI